MRARNTGFGLSAAVAAFMALNAGPAAADAASEARLDELYKQAYGVTPQNANASTASPEQLLAWYGVIGAGPVIRRLESEIEGLLAAAEQKGAALTRAMTALEAQSKTSAVTQAEGGLGGRDTPHSIGWYCTKITELKNFLPGQMQGLTNFGIDYVQQLRAIPVGRDDSIEQLDSLTTRFIEGLERWSKDPAFNQFSRDMAEVRAGIATMSGAANTFIKAGEDATKAAEELRNAAVSLETRGTRLVFFVDRYLKVRQELQSDLPGLALDSAGDVARRDSISAAIGKSYDPTRTLSGWRALIGTAVAQISARDTVAAAINNSQEPMRTVVAWRALIDGAVTEKSSQARDATARVEALTGSMRSESEACKSMPDPAAEFTQVTQEANQWFNGVMQAVSSAWTERSLTIDKLDKEHADLIAENEAQAKNLGDQIIEAERKYDALPQGSPERQRLYAEIVKAREIGAGAAQAAMELKLSRQGLVPEQQAAQRIPVTIKADIDAKMSLLVTVSSN